MFKWNTPNWLRNILIMKISDLGKRKPGHDFVEANIYIWNNVQRDIHKILQISKKKPIEINKEEELYIRK